MFLKSIILVSVLLAAIVASQEGVNDCNFEMDGYRYNFTKLVKAGGYPITKPNGDIFTINVCTITNECYTGTGTHNITACKKTSAGVISPIGLLNYGSFLPMYNPGMGAYVFYTNPTLGSTVSITLWCDPNKPVASVIYGGETSPLLYEFMITGADICGTLIQPYQW